MAGSRGGQVGFRNARPALGIGVALLLAVAAPAVPT